MLIIGGDSEIGRATVSTLRRSGVDVVTTTRRQEAVKKDCLHFDLSLPFEPLPDLPGKSACLICAAETSTEACWKKPAKTAAINVEATAKLAVDLVERGFFVLFLSSNHVFDGSRPHRKDDDSPCPIIEYGRQKAAAEVRLSNLGSDCGVLRLTKVLGPRPPRFVEWKQALLAGRTVTAFEDMTIAPLPLQYAADAIVRILTSRVGGIFQASGDQDITYAEILQDMASQIGADRRLVKRASVLDANLPEPVPVHTTLDASRLKESFALERPSSIKTVHDVVTDL